MAVVRQKLLGAVRELVAQMTEGEGLAVRAGLYGCASDELLRQSDRLHRLCLEELSPPCPVEGAR